MAEVVTFVGYRPPARYDTVPWTEMRIEEAATADGAYTELEVVPLDPVDTDPAQPLARSATTELGTAIDYWYRIVWADGTGDTSVPTTPVQNVTGGSVPTTAVPYVTVEQFLTSIKVTSRSDLTVTQAERVLLATAGEINSEIGLTADTTLTGWQYALAGEVNLERAAEHWQQVTAGFGIIGLDQGLPMLTARDSWDRHAHKLAPLKTSWGLS